MHPGAMAAAVVSERNAAGLGVGARGPHVVALARGAARPARHAARPPAAPRVRGASPAHAQATAAAARCHATTDLGFWGTILFSLYTSMT